MISHRFPFDKFFDAFAMAQDREHSAKVLVTFPE
jgi:threonine dehydrogenase-like Zn-dependent dehydrogenase